MPAPIVLLHGSANGSFSYRAIKSALTQAGKTVFAPDLIGYGDAPKASPNYGIREEVGHLANFLEERSVREFHLVAHSLGAMIGLHLARALRGRVTRLTLIDPVVVSVLRAPGEETALAEMEAQYGRFMDALPDNERAACAFVEHWSGAGTWDAIGQKAHAVLASLAPKIRLEMISARTDLTDLAALTEFRPHVTTVMVGEKTLVAPRATARLFAGALGGKTVIVPGAAHMIPLTHPTAVVDAVIETDDE
jgi:pimeloyl-ACP methyl ester carboxylesterase